MRALERKLLRDSLHMAAQLAAIALIVAAAIATYVTMRGSYEALEKAQSDYYARNRFANLFVQMKRAPLRVATDIAALPGVRVVDPRIVVSVKLDVPNLPESATARIVSIEGHLNTMSLQSGRLPLAGRDDEVVASEHFAKANRLRAGDRLAAVLNGKWEQLRIVGVGTTPEYVVEVAGAAVIPDARRFAILWMRREALEGAFSMRGAFNDAAILIDPGTDPSEVIVKVDAILARYGGLGAYGRDEHHPHRVVASELTQLRVTALLIPAIFLFVSAFLVHTVLSRLIASQRDQIAVLKAFGYSNARVAAHYTGFAIVVVIAGCLIGIPAGIWLGRGMLSLYLDFFNFPKLVFRIAPASVAVAVLITAASAIIATLRSSLAVSGIAPAEGMRGEQPPAFHQTHFERLHRVLSSGARMIARSVERRPLRAATSVFGIALAVMMLIVARFTFDAIDEVLAIHLRTAERHDVMVTFSEPVRGSAKDDLARLPGVRRVEMFRAIPVRVVSGHRTRRIVLLGLPPDAQLRRIIDRNRRVVPLPDRGIVLTRALADAIAVPAGEHVTLEQLDGKRMVMQPQLAALADELFGIGAFARGDEVARLAGESDLASGAYLSVDPARRDDLDRELKRIPAIAGVTYRETMIRSYLDLIAKSLSSSTTAIVIFACVIAFGIVYNSARISLSERGRDLATLRVLGFTRKETGVLLLGEQALLTAAGIPIGFLLGYATALWLVRFFETEEYRLVGTVSATTYGFALLVVLIASVVSGAAVWRRILRLDLVEVLKSRE